MNRHRDGSPNGDKVSYTLAVATGWGTVTRMEQPGTTWEFSLSAAEELVLWHLASGDVPSVVRQRRTTVLVAAAVHAVAADAGLSGQQVADVPLVAAVGQASVLTTLRDYALSALEAAPVGELGNGDREELLAAYGTGGWGDVQTAALEVVDHHVLDAVGVGRPYPSIRDRAAAMARTVAEVARARRKRMHDDLADAEVEQW